MAQLVAVLEVELRRRRGEGKPDDRRRPSPADRQQRGPHQKSGIWPAAEGGRKRLQSRLRRLRPAPWALRPKRRHARAKRLSVRSAHIILAGMRPPKRRSLSPPPRVQRTMPLT